MTGRCDQCRARMQGEGHRTSTRMLCDDCYAQFSGLAAGFIAGGTVADAVSTAGWNSARRKQRKKG